MTVAKDVKKYLQNLEPGEVFSIQDFRVKSGSEPTVVRLLNRYVAQHKLSRLSKGRYFIPRHTRFGPVPPKVEEVVKDYLIKGDEVIGYISGIAAFAKLGLTTQISSELLIGSATYRRPTERTSYKIRFFLQRNPITRDSIPYLQLLDAIKYFREIPGTTSEDALRGLIDILRMESPTNRRGITELALAYPNYVRALLGAILEYVDMPSAILRESLNWVSSYKLSIPSEVLPTKSNWNIL